MNINEDALGQKFKELYELGDYIDGGGNGSVYKITRKSDNAEFALKCLRNHKGKRAKRFKDEIKTLKDIDATENEYVISLVDNNTSSDGIFWYVMPLGCTVSKYFETGRFDFNRKILVMIEIAEGVKSLHDSNYCHRDIKPSNILIVKNHIKLADFGLVWHPDFDSITDIHEKVGAVETIAPEMREDNPVLKHSPKADVYSFVKTIWMLLLGRERAFVGQYCLDTAGYLNTENELFENEEIKTLYRLNQLIAAGTEYDPYRRPTIDEVITELKNVISDNLSSDDNIAKINEKEKMSIILLKIPSDSEKYVDIEIIARVLENIFLKTTYAFVSILPDGNVQEIFFANRIQMFLDDRLVIFVDTNMKSRYLVKVVYLELDKKSQEWIMEVDGVEMHNIPKSDINDYVDYYDGSQIDKILNFQSVNTNKNIVNVMTRSDKYVLKIR